MAKSYPPTLVLVLSFLITANSSNTIDLTDLTALHEIQNSLSEIPSSPATSFFSTWNFSFTGADPCSSFSGVACSSTSGRVTILSLGTGLSDSPGLGGTLSPAVAHLSELTQLILFDGIVTGPIPAMLGSLQNLKVIILTNNRLTGEIPIEIFRLRSLHTLDLRGNQLSGAVPLAIPDLNQLKVMVLASNKLSGQIPRIFPDQLLHLDLSNNLFSGNLPTRMPEALRYLSIANNRMWGTIEGLGSLSDLAYVDLSENKFGGPIPLFLFRPSVTSMFLQRNNFTGRVPQSPSWSCSTVDLSHNFLTGELTAALAGAETLYLNNNRLNGAVPEEYVESLMKGAMRTLYLQHNYLTGFPLEVGSALPDTASVCVSYNCMGQPPLGFAACPSSAGDQLSRPDYQCSAFH